MLVNLGLNLALIVPLQHMGPPLATAIASTVNVALLYTTLRKRGHFAADQRLKRRAPRLAMAALAMGAVLWTVQDQLLPYLHGGWGIRFAALALLVSAGGIVYATLTVPAVMLQEAFLSFLGLGVQPPAASWGVLVNEGATVMSFFPWLATFPGLALALTLFGLNFLGDGLRDALDPHLRKD